MKTRRVVAAGIVTFACAAAAFAQPPAPPVITRLPAVTFAGQPSVQRERQPTSTPAGKAFQRMADHQRAADARKPAAPKTICGTTVIEQSPDVDARVILPADRSAGAAVRRIEPQACNSAR
jgi:hypothetical protein